MVATPIYVSGTEGLLTLQYWGRRPIIVCSNVDDRLVDLDIVKKCLYQDKMSGERLQDQRSSDLLFLQLFISEQLLLVLYCHNTW